MTLRPNFRGSTLSLVFGLLNILSGITKPRMPGILVGAAMAIGAVIYQSAKKTRLGRVGSSRNRSLLEGLGVIAIIGLLVLVTLRYYITAQTSIYAVIFPVWALAAYAAARLGTAAREPEAQPELQTQDEA